MTDDKPVETIIMRPLTLDTLGDYIAEITGIYEEAVRETVATVELVAPDVDVMFGRLSRNLATGYPAYVAVVDDATERVAGYAYCSAFRSANAFWPTVEHSIYVDQTQRGQGIGQKLLRALIDECATRDFRQMIAVVEVGQAKSLAFHKTLGFVEVGRMRSLAYKHDQWCTVVLMQLEIGDGDSSPPQNPS